MSNPEDPSLYPASSRTRPSRNPQRVTYDRSDVHEVLDGAFVCHVGFVVDGRPVVLPHLYARVGDVLYLHGSTGARALLSAEAAGLPVCVTVTLLDGIVFARSAFHHSMNYRSVVAQGVATVVREEAEKRSALDALVDAAAEGRAAQTRRASAKELAATSVLSLPLVEVSLKTRSGPPNDDADDLALEHWAGVLPLRLAPGRPVPAEDVRAEVPPNVRDWRRGLP